MILKYHTSVEVDTFLAKSIMVTVSVLPKYRFRS
jgi:hypothetical protein